MTKPSILILSAPSGTGKTSLSRALISSRNDAELTVSHTTRSQRPGEINGQHYCFIGKSKFLAMINNGEFIEHAVVFDHYYGTSIKSIETLIINNKHAILDIDWQGARSVKSQYPTSKSVFIMPPSLEVLDNRLRRRRQDSEDVIERRMKDAKNEIGHRDEYDFIITNNDFDEAIRELRHILDNL